MKGVTCKTVKDKSYKAYEHTKQQRIQDSQMFGSRTERLRLESVKVCGMHKPLPPHAATKPDKDCRGYYQDDGG